MNICIIPAREGSKGIPDKNIRSFNGKPLIVWGIEAAKRSHCDSVVVTTDSERIAQIARFHGCDVVMRGKDLSSDEIPLDPVIMDAACHYNAQKIVTVQPTSPQVTSYDINRALTMLDKFDSVISVVDDSHLRWSDNGPLYKERVNRQQLPREYRETGAVIACTSRQLKSGARIGGRVGLLKVSKRRGIDIDDNIDWMAAESIAKIKTIVICVIGNSSVGMGHIYRGLTIANDLPGYNIIFACRPSDYLAIAHIGKHNYPLIIGDFIETINEVNPDLVINDILDTDQEYMAKIPCKTVNFEDLGDGLRLASAVINDLYGDGQYIGQDYYCLRDEFIYTVPNPEKGRILVTFGGVDERNLTCEAIKQLIGHKMTVITGPGYRHHDELEALLTSDIEHISSTDTISQYMARADVAVTSGGRTVYELLSLGIPTVVCCQNDREMTHIFDNVVNLGMDQSGIKTAVEALIGADRPIVDLSQGRRRVKEIIECLLHSS